MRQNLPNYRTLKHDFYILPYLVNQNFNSNVLQLNKKFQPECIVVHSTIRPGTTEQLQKKLKIPIIFSATRGVHKRMIQDLQKYQKIFCHI